MPTNPQSRFFLKEHLASWKSLFQGAKECTKRLISDFTVEIGMPKQDLRVYWTLH